MYQIGRNSGIVLSFLNYFFTVFFYVFCRKRSVQCISVIEKQITRRGWNRWYVQSQYHSIFFHNQTFLRNSWRIFYHINRFCASKHSYWICWFFKKNIIKYVQYNTHIYMPLETRIILPVFKHVFDYLVKLPCLSYLSFWRVLLMHTLFRWSYRRGYHRCPCCCRSFGTSRLFPLPAMEEKQGGEESWARGKWRRESCQSEASR